MYRVDKSFLPVHDWAGQLSEGQSEGVSRGASCLPSRWSGERYRPPNVKVL